MSNSVLALSHSFVVDTNRDMLSELSQIKDVDVDIVMPAHWKSNLIKDLHYNYNEKIDKHFNRLYPVKVYGKGNASAFIFNPLSLFNILRKKKYTRIFLAQETWSLSLLFLNICKLFTVNRSTQIDLWVCQNIKKEKLYWLRFFERINTLNVGHILHCCGEIKDVIKWKGIKNRCLYFPFSFSPSQYKENFEQRNHKAENITVGYLGRLSEEKGTDQLIKSFQKLLEENKHIDVKVAGGGPDSHKFKSFCDNHPRCQFLGILKHSEAHLFYRDLDLFILTSQTRPFWKEQFGRVIIEAAASGCNLVGSNSGAIPEVMAKCELIHVYDENSQKDLDCKIKEALTEIGSLNYSSQQKKRHLSAMNQFSHKSVANLYKTYLDKKYES